MTDQSPLTRTDLVDIVTPSRRGAAVYKDILVEAAQSPEKWIRHHFIVVFDTDTDHERLKLEHWLAHTREVLPLPRVTVLTATETERRNQNALRQKALEQGSNPYVYFQDDDDFLPLNLDHFLQAAEEEQELAAVYGVTETVNSKHHLIEQFPTLHNNMFEVDAEEASRWFPTYAHPIAALFKRDMVEDIPIYKEGDPSFCTGASVFCLRLTESGKAFKFIPKVIRQVKLHEDNDDGILTEILREEIARDIKDWLSEIRNEDIKGFHLEIAEALEKGWITTFREIAAMVEMKLGY
ncbi:MAG: hypothetical protein VX730_04850 [Pseudomonadota bacterium]|nr:hypothetical protein [Pseudomonadota bacterium]